MPNSFEEEVRGILEQFYDEAFLEGSESRGNTISVYKFIDKTLSKLKSLMRIDEGELGEVIKWWNEPENKNCEVCGICPSGIKTLAHQIALKKDEWLK